MPENTETAIERKPDADAPMEWRDREDVAALAKRLQVLLPGKLTREEALLLAQYAAAMDANPFRGEVYAYSSKGKLVLTEGYKLLTRWAKRQDGYSEHYEPLDVAELPEEDIGYTCWILRDQQLPLLKTLIDGGAPWDEAFHIAATSAVGVVTKADRTKRNGDPMDPPVGWTWEEVARKRAMKNALNRAFGSPSPREIAKETWMVGDIKTTPEDWQLVDENIAPGAGLDERARVARMIHEQRERGEDPHNPDVALPVDRRPSSRAQLFKTTSDRRPY